MPITFVPKYHDTFTIFNAYLDGKVRNDLFNNGQNKSVIEMEWEEDRIRVMLYCGTWFQQMSKQMKRRIGFLKKYLYELIRAYPVPAPTEIPSIVFTIPSNNDEYIRIEKAISELTME